MVPLAFTINLYEGYGPFMTVRTLSTNTLPVRTLGIGKSMDVQRFEFPPCVSFLEAVQCKSSIGGCPGRACVASVLALS